MTAPFGKKAGFIGWWMKDGIGHISRRQLLKTGTSSHKSSSAQTKPKRQQGRTLHSAMFGELRV